VLLGPTALAHPSLAVLRALAGALGRAAKLRLGCLPEGANSAGAWLAGAVPHRGPGGTLLPQSGLHLAGMCATGLRGALLLGVEPGLDCADPAAAARTLEAAEFVLALASFAGPELRRHADLILPITPFTETAGTYVNVEGCWQSFTAAVAPYGESRPGWKVLRVLGNLLRVDGFDYLSAEEVREELYGVAGAVKPGTSMPWHCPEGLGDTPAGLTRVGEVPIYAVDALVRRATALQQTPDSHSAAAHINAKLAKRLGLADATEVVAKQGGAAATLPLVIDARVPDGAVLVPAGVPGTEVLGPAFGPIELERA
jgi:NADH-quinone oxidoreductase subunit G